MRYDLSDPFQAQQAKDKLQHLIKKGAKIELTEKRYNRTRSQNAYYHLIVSWWGLELGYTMEEMKQVVASKCPQLFNYEHASGKTFTRSTSDMNTKEMTTLIDWVRNTAATESGCYLPSPNEKEQLASMEANLQAYKAFM